MKYFIGIILLLMTSCGYVTPAQIKAANTLCASNGGVEIVNAVLYTREMVETDCMNGARFFKRIDTIESGIL